MPDCMCVLISSALPISLHLSFLSLSLWSHSFANTLHALLFRFVDVFHRKYNPAAASGRDDADDDALIEVISLRH